MDCPGVSEAPLANVPHAADAVVGRRSANIHATARRKRRVYIWSRFICFSVSIFIEQHTATKPCSLWCLSLLSMSRCMTCRYGVRREDTLVAAMMEERLWVQSWRQRSWSNWYAYMQGRLQRVSFCPPSRSRSRRESLTRRLLVMLGTFV